jgi:hypothetical protein
MHTGADVKEWNSVYFGSEAPIFGALTEEWSNLEVAKNSRR